jgi:uncharacterized protein (TIGR03435 family)
MTARTATRPWALVGCLLLAELALGARAQRAPASGERLSFEVASVRQNPDTVASPTFELSPSGRLTVTAYPLFQLIRIAYVSNSIETEQQIVGGPNWLKSDRFDVVAKANGSIEADETGRPTRLLAMLRALLEDRFHLRVHTELREASVYLLVPANRDGKPGPQLHQSAQDCHGPVGNLVQPDSPRWCGWRGGGTGHYTIQGLTMADFATGVAGTWTVGRPVIDRTKLAGRWDAQIDFVPTFVAGPNADSAPVPNPNPNSGPDMLSAMRDQLGLKLEGAKANIDFLVIDHVERPSPD